MPRRRTVIIAAALTASALVAAGPLLPGCGASDQIRNEDPPDTTGGGSCGETGECEGSSPADVYDTYVQLACANRTAGDWDAAALCVDAVDVMTVAERTVFMERWLWGAE